MKLFEYQAKSLLRGKKIPTSPSLVIDKEEGPEFFFEKYGLSTGEVAIEWIDQIGQKGEERHPYLSKETFQKAVHGLFSYKANREGAYSWSNVWVAPTITVDDTMSLELSCDDLTGKIQIEIKKKYLSEMRVFKEEVLRNRRLYTFQKRALFFALHLPFRLQDPFFTLLDRFVELYYSYDLIRLKCRLSLLAYGEGVVAHDMDIEADDFALIRQPEMQYLYEHGQLPPLLKEERDVGCTSYPSSGSIGCIVTGKGLLQATLDALQLQGGKAGFSIDVGEVAEAQKVRYALSRQLLCPTVTVILLHLFLEQNDSRAFIQLVIEELQKSQRSVPLIVRMASISLREARALVSHSSLPIYVTEQFDEAVQWTVKHEGGSHAHSH